MLTDVLGVGVQHGLDDVAQELGDLLGAAARKGFGGELGLDFLAGQAERRVSLDAGNHVVGLALLLDNGSGGHGVLTQTLVHRLYGVNAAFAETQGGRMLVPLMD